MARPLKPATPFAERLIQARGAMSRDDAAAALGCKTDTLGDYERGRTFPPPEVLERVPDVYGVSLDWLITGQGEMRRQTAPADGVSSTANTTASAVDEELLARIGEEIVEMYRLENGRISQHQLARLQARTYADLVTTYDDPAERLVGLKMAIQQLRRDLRAPPVSGDASKRLA